MVFAQKLSLHVVEPGSEVVQPPQVHPRLVGFLEPLAPELGGGLRVSDMFYYFQQLVATYYNVEFVILNLFPVFCLKKLILFYLFILIITAARVKFGDITTLAGVVPWMDHPLKKNIFFFQTVYFGKTPEIHIFFF